ncbi:MAG: ATP-binding protein [Tannerellaceae bacterium]|nr:ATP-binding protein [Tannerellaceae bacterium]
MIDHESPGTVTWQVWQHQEKRKDSLPDNVIYCIEEDINNHTLWIGTRNGLSILDLDNPAGGFINYLPETKENALPYNELNALERDKNGIMWLGMLGGGIYSVNMTLPPFESYSLESVKQTIFSNSVRSLLVDSYNTLWLGVGSHGLAIMDKDMNEPVFYTEHPHFRAHSGLHTVTCMLEHSKTKGIWISIAGNGIYIYNRSLPGNKIKKLTSTTTPWLTSPFILSMKEDASGNIWLGSRSELFIIQPDSSVTNIVVNQPVNSLVESSDKSIWIGTGGGIAHYTGSVKELKEESLTWYNSSNGKLSFDNTGYLFTDSKGRIWVGSEGGGLSLYDENTDAFIQVNNRYNILADGVYSIEEDNQGRLWIATNSTGLICLDIAGDLSTASLRTYTTSDGLQDNYFTQGASCKAPDGKLYFGSHKGYNAFYPENIDEKEGSPEVVITDITVFNHSIKDMNAGERVQITDKTADFAENIVLNHRRNHFSIEFSLLSYANPMRNKFAYRLEGYDNDWQYTGASNRMANYNNLQSGTYTFRLKGANENGVWSENERLLQITILPPPWKTGWAYITYILLATGMAIVTYRLIQNRIRRKQRYQLQQIEQAKSEEINHAKLQFFTNVTHELLTPLTILSASLDDLKLSTPQNKGTYKIMYENLNRLFRLLQQILEFRKAETGNLKLKVSEGELVSFIRKEIEAFTPLIKKKKMNVTFTSDPEEITGFFDSDKLDKIVYNLLSNASKYNREGGEISINVSHGKTTKELLFSIRDNGEGIPPEAMKSLFKRFYEGDYRRFNTTGTGIGLSLTQDLVKLHKGFIEVESEPGKGTCFTVTIPITKEAFSPGEIDENSQTPVTKTDLYDLPEETTGDNREKEKTHSLLLVEDNDSLLSLMFKLLSRDYHVYTAVNGVEALSIIEKEEIDLVVSDIMMPVMDGVELCKKIKNTIEFSHIPVLLLTAKKQEEDRIEAYESGADGFISKPFNLSLLHARIQNLLKKKEQYARDFKKQIVFEVQDMEYTSMDEEFLEKAIQCVHRHLKDIDFDQAQFIEEMHTSKSTLYKKLKSLTGLNTSGFIRNIRLKAACKLMEEKGNTIRVSELAYAVGFNDPKYFSACFKKEFGMLPSEYMERYNFINPKEE